MKSKVLLFLFLIATHLLLAQDNLLRHYSVNDGLPGNETYSVFQDSKGYIWIASDMGASRFNGYAFRVYSTADGLTDNTLFGFYEDYHARIWFYTFSGKLCYFLNDSISSADIPVNDKIRDFLGSKTITGMTVGKDDTILLATWKGLLKIIPSRVNGRLIWNEMDVMNNKSTFLTKNGYLTVEELPDAKTKITVIKGQTKTIIINKREFSSNLVSANLNMDGSLLLFYSYGIAHCDSSGIIGYSNKIKFGISAFQENDSTFWIGEMTHVSGSVITGGVRQYRSMDLGSPQKEFLKGFSVTCILKDRENGCWFSTLEEGVFYLPSPDFSYLSIPEKDTYSEIRLSKVGQNNLLAIGHKIIMRNTGKWNMVTALSAIWHQLPSKRIEFWNAFTHSGGSTWFSTNGGVAVIDLKTEKLIHYIDLSPHPNTKCDSRLLIEDRGHDIWSLNRSSLTKIDSRNYKILNTIPLPSVAETMCEDFNGNILIGTLTGMYTFSNDSLHYLGSQNPIYQNRFVDIKKFDSVIVAATRGGGLFIITPDSILQLTNSSGLLSNMCRSVFIDGDSTIWVATNRGLNSITFIKYSCTTHISSYTIADGLPSYDIAQVVKTGRIIWMLGARGVSAFDPEEVLTKRSPPPVYITGLKIDNVKHRIDNITALSYSTNFIQIDFEGLTYKNPGKQEYKYRLVGYDSAWAFTKGTSVQFTKLPPGEYRFTVFCINASGVESSFPAVLAFTIDTPIYRKRWFDTLILIILFSLIAIVSVIISGRIIKRERVKIEAKRRIANLELQALRAQMNPHFVFNCLAAIRDFILKKDPESAEHYLSGFSKLIRKVLENSRRQRISLAEEIDFLNLYIDLERMRFDNKFDSEIHVADELLEGKVEIPSMLLQPFVENAIRHGKIGNLEQPGKLRISFSLQGNILICQIADNGIGLKKTAAMKSRRNLNHEPHALDIIKEHLGTINDVHKFLIEYEIIDLSDLSPEKTGTLVEIRIPITPIEEI